MIEIDMTGVRPIQFGLTGTAEIIQNVRMILSTIQGTVPLGRGFGIDSVTFDDPIPIAKARLTSAIMTAIATYEPRVFVSEVRFTEDHQLGRLVPIVVLGVQEEVTQ